MQIMAARQGTPQQPKDEFNHENKSESLRMFSSRLFP
jgi:hypothetical protein